MSPVPGGRSTSRKSGSSQYTSVRNCSSALCSIGPRQMTGWSSSAKNPMEMQRTPFASGGRSISSSTTGFRSTPSIFGIEKPQTSASSTPTDLPRCARATARLVVTDDLPTPPLPDAISSTRVRDAGSAKGIARPCAWPCAGCEPAVAAGSPCRPVRRACSSSGVITVNSTVTALWGSRPLIASVTRRSISARRGHPGTVSAISTPTDPEARSTRFTIPRSTMLRCSSGSSTGRSASMTSASVRDMGPKLTGMPNELPPLSPTEFASAVTAITSAFGDPTRRDIYLHVRDADHGVTAAEVAECFELHPNVARHHLDKLAGGGYVEVAVDRLEGAGAGRPSKRYRVLEKNMALELPVRHDDLLVTLLGKSLSMLPREQAEAMAEEVGVQYGRAMAESIGASSGGTEGVTRSFRTALHAVADALTAHGFAAHAEKSGTELRIVSGHCPFGGAAIEHPVICAVDRGLVKGMLAALYGDTSPATQSSLPMGDDICVTAVEA